MADILTFEEALDKSQNTKRNLLLGNGFSMDFDSDKFNYTSLYKEASERIKKEMPETQKLFETLQTKDFEHVIKLLQHASAVTPFYFPNSQETTRKMIDNAEKLKEILVFTIASSHPEFPAKVSDKQFSACRKFLSHFIGEELKGKVYSLNYDLLLYWVVMHDSTDNIKLNKNDGFGKDSPIESLITWQNEAHTRNQNIFYLHGALHLYDTGTELEKYTWINQQVSLIDQARDSLTNDKFPLFVTEGQSNDKLFKIKHDPYLHHCYKSFLSELKEDRRKKNNKKSLFIFGHSLDDNDGHIIQKIGKGTHSYLYVSIYGDSNTSANKKIINKALSLANKRSEGAELEVNFYCAQSADVWGNNHA